MKILLAILVFNILVPSILMNGAFFRLINDADETNTKVLLWPEFFACSMEKTCSYVLQNKQTKKFKTAKDKKELDSLKEPFAIWEKMSAEEGKTALLANIDWRCPIMADRPF